MLKAEDLPLPVLREDLLLQPGPPAADDSPSWTIYDPARGRYFRIGWTAFQMLSRWSLATASALLKVTNKETTCHLTQQDLNELLRFLFANNLTVNPINGDYHSYLQQNRASSPPWYQQLVHSYLFFRIPLLRPDRFLRLSLPYLHWCFASRMLYILGGIGVLGLYLVSRQWETFTATFLHFFDWEGALYYGLALIFSKTLHELGHAYTAVRLGCRVPVMGIAFMALFPMPYTDVTDAWRLRSRRQRVAIDGAGISVELALAVLATLAWSFLPDGPTRSAAFVLATTTWITTLTINLSPFMRFDGYYLLADAWGVDNLQMRAFALARWRLRRLIFGATEAKPEVLPLAKEHKMVVYSYITWIYRLLVFTGLALMVYQFFFKLLGIILFLIEIIWFILRPIVQELRIWHKMDHQKISVIRKMALSLILILILLIFLLPWSDSVRIPSLLEAEHHTTLYVPEPAQIDAVLIKSGQTVAAGQVLLKLKSPKLDDDIGLSEKRLDLYRLRLERATTSRETSADMRVAMQQWSTEAARLTGLQQQRERLLVRAPYAGIIMDMNPALHPQRWVDTALPLATLVAPDQAVVLGVAQEDDLIALAVGQTGHFVPEDVLGKSIDIEVTEIGSVNIHELDRPYLASVYGGAIAVRQNAHGKLAPTASVFAVRFTPKSTPSLTRIQRGTAFINAKPRSFVRRLFDGSAALLVRESGF